VKATAGRGEIDVAAAHARWPPLSAACGRHLSVSRSAPVGDVLRLQRPADAHRTSRQQVPDAQPQSPLYRVWRSVGLDFLTEAALPFRARSDDRL
jgi:hypothetical protein